MTRNRMTGLSQCLVEPMCVGTIQQRSHKPHDQTARIRLQLLFLTIIVVLAHPQHLMGAASPQFIMEAPESLEPVATRLQNINPAALLRLMEFIGLEHPGPPIRVILAPNESPLAQEAPAWISGYAVSGASTIVLFTDRTLTYPNDSLSQVFLHEIAHILAHRAAGEQPLPRWFDEGLAMVAARHWDLEDRARLVWAMVSGTEVSLNELNRLFVSDDNSVRRAYVLAHAFTLDLLEHTQGDVPKQILAKVKQGLTFPEAFAQSTFMTLAQAEEDFWNRQTLWNRWIPVATSSGMVWLTITLLAMWVYTKQRKRSAAIKKEWREDDWDV